MDKRKIGVTVLILSLLFGVVVLNLIGNTKEAATDEGCFATSECSTLSYTLSASHIGIGLLFAFFTLGLYLLFLGKSEEALLQQLRQQKEHIAKEDKLKIVQLLLSENEKKIFNAILEHEGITQSTLRFKTDLSKATVSQILSDFEKKNIISRELKGKTYAVYLKGSF